MDSIDDPSNRGSASAVEPDAHGKFDLAGLRATILARTPALVHLDLSNELSAIIDGLDRQDPYLGYSHISGPLADRFARLVGQVGVSGACELRQLLLIELIAQFDRRFERSGLHADFRLEFMRNFGRILADIASSPTSPESVGLNDDRFLKDLGIARLSMIPCVSHLVYRHSGVPRRIFLEGRRPAALFSIAYTLARAGGFRPFLENHVHPAMLDRFNQAGRQQCYRLVARLLESWPDARGLIGTSWYYDPEVGRISPRLAYLHDEPASVNACFVDMGEHPDARASALSRSATRVQLAQAGLYRPRNYMMIWTRADILGRFGD